MSDDIAQIHGSTVLYSTLFDWDDETWEWEAYWRDNACKFDDLWDE